MTDILRFIGINRDTTTAGPGKRLEFFTKGCIRGVIAPCQGCFNESTWTFEGLYREMTVDEVVDMCVKTAWNRQVTFCGGEPILQARAIMKVAKRLKEIDPTFHFVMYTAYKLDTLMKYGLKFTWVREKHGDAMFDALLKYSHSYQAIDMKSDGDWSFIITKAQFTILTPEDVTELMKHIDIIVDGDYQQDKRLTTDKFMHEGWFVGSANQRVIFAPASVRTGKLMFLYADEYNKQMQNAKTCRCCGHVMTSSSEFCSKVCEERYEARQKEVAFLGGV